MGIQPTRQRLGIWYLPSSWSNHFLSIPGLKLAHLGSLVTHLEPIFFCPVWCQIAYHLASLDKLDMAAFILAKLGDAILQLVAHAWLEVELLGFFLSRSQCLACSTSGQLGLSAGKQSPWDHVGLHQAIAKVAETLW